MEGNVRRSPRLSKIPRPPDNPKTPRRTRNSIASSGKTPSKIPLPTAIPAKKRRLSSGRSSSSDSSGNDQGGFSKPRTPNKGAKSKKRNSTDVVGAQTSQENKEAAMLPDNKSELSTENDNVIEASKEITSSEAVTALDKVNGTGEDASDKLPTQGQEPDNKGKEVNTEEGEANKSTENIKSNESELLNGKGLTESEDKVVSGPENASGESVNGLKDVQANLADESLSDLKKVAETEQGQSLNDESKSAVLPDCIDVETAGTGAPRNVDEPQKEQEETKVGKTFENNAMEVGVENTKIKTPVNDDDDGNDIQFIRHVPSQQNISKENKESNKKKRASEKVTNVANGENQEVKIEEGLGDEKNLDSQGNTVAGDVSDAQNAKPARVDKDGCNISDVERIVEGTMESSTDKASDKKPDESPIKINDAVPDAGAQTGDTSKNVDELKAESVQDETTDLEKMVTDINDGKLDTVDNGMFCTEFERKDNIQNMLDATDGQPTVEKMAETGMEVAITDVEKSTDNDLERKSDSLDTELSMEH